MPYLLTILVFLFSAGFENGFNNNVISGEVLDTKTKAPIPYVNIWLKQQDIRWTSNSEGKFILNINPAFHQDTVVFSSIGYKPFVITIKQLLANKSVKKTVLLAEDTFPLQEVLVRPLTARQIVQKAIEYIPENHLHSNYQVQGFYRQAVKENDSFASLIESVVQIKSEKENQPFRVSYIKSRLSKDYRTYKLAPERDIIAKALALDHIQYRRGFLNSHNQSNWQFKIVGYTKLNQKDIYIIQASLPGNNKTAVHQAQIYIRSEDYAFQRIDYDYTWNSANLPEEAAPSDTIIFKRYNWKGSFNYIPYRGKMVLNYFHFVLKQHIYSRNYIAANRGRFKNLKLVATQESQEEFIANDISVLKQPLPPIQAAITASGFTESAKTYDESFWKSYLMPVDTKLFISIKKDLEKQASFDKLFQAEAHLAE